MILVDDLIAQVRSQADEANADDITDAQILQALNRAQRHTANIVARKYEEMMWDTTTVTTTAGTREYDIPSEAFGSRITKIEVVSGNNNLRYQLTKLSNHQNTNYITVSKTDLPAYYSIRRNKFEVFPTPSGGLTLYVHYYKKPGDLVKQQGRITSIDTENNYVLVDDIGDSLSTSVSGFAAYVNIIDYRTGNVKQSLQISALNTTTNKITFKSSGLTRSTVLGNTIDTEISSSVAVDDYVCLVTGTCVPEIDEAYTDYILQHALVAIKRRMGEPTAEDFAELKQLEDEVMKAWNAREASLRVRRSSRNWGSRNTGIRRRLII